MSAEARKKCGIVVTYHNHAADFVVPCIESLLAHTPAPRYILLFDNQSSEKDAISLPEKYKDSGIEFVRIDDQQENGGLTGTWNQGIEKCFENGCEKVVLLNHDTVVNESWPVFLGAIERGDRVYGPVSDKPGRGPYEAQIAENETVFRDSRIERETELVNGFCLGFAKKALLSNKYDEKHYFDPHFPWGGNEEEWQYRFILSGGRAVIVEGCFVSHHKQNEWRKFEKKDRWRRLAIGWSRAARSFKKKINLFLRSDFLKRAKARTGRIAGKIGGALRRGLPGVFAWLKPLESSLKDRIQKLLAPKREFNTSILAVFSGEHRGIGEWISHHRNIGVQHFYLYDLSLHASERDAAVAQYVKKGIADYVNLPGSEPDDAHAAGIKRSARESRWLAAINLDEFIWLPGPEKNLHHVLRAYSDHSGLAVNLLFLPAESKGRAFCPSDFSIEAEDTWKKSPSIRTIARPDRIRTDRLFGLNNFAYAQGRTVDENHKGVFGLFNPDMPGSVIRIYSYGKNPAEKLGDEC